MGKNDILTKRRLLDVLDGSTWCSNAEDGKKALYDKYSALLKSILAYCPDNVCFDRVDALEMFRTEGKLEEFVFLNDVPSIERKMNDALAAIRARADLFVSKSAELVKRQEKHRSVFGLLWWVFVISALVIMLLGIADIIWEMPALLTRIALVTGPLDGLAGIVFFIYERNADRKEKALQDSIMHLGVTEDDEPKQNFQATSIVVKGSGQVGNFYNRGGSNDDL